MKIRRTSYTCLASVCLTLCFAFGCSYGPSDPRKSARLCEERIKKNIDPLTLQSWATNLLVVYGTDRTNFAGPFPSPDYLARVCADGAPGIYIQGGYSNSPSFIRVFWGAGGSGHWGILIGTRSYVPQTYEAPSVVSWAPGIFFFEDYR